MAAWKKLGPWAATAEKKLLNVIVETPKGQRNKFKYSPKLGCFVLGKVLPAGAVFPFDFGFVPKTKAADGDPLDVLLLMDAPAFPGCLVQARLIGVIAAEQQARGEEALRNDRLIAVADEAQDFERIRSPKDLDANLLEEFEHFFVSYHAHNGTQFHVLEVAGPKKALTVIKAANRKAAARRKHRI